jgi:hypothetical protein
VLTDNSTSTTFLNTDGLMSKQTIADAVGDEIGTEIEYAAFSGGVWVSTAGTSGTAYPIGTPVSPVDNLVDAHTIMVTRGFTEMYFQTDWTFQNGDVMANHHLIGQGPQKTVFTFEAGSVNAFCKLSSAEITGAITGAVGFEDCKIKDLGSVGVAPSSVDVLAKNCLIEGTLTLPSNYSGTMVAVDCWAVPDTSGSPPIFDMGNSTADLQIRNYSGILKLKNCTNVVDIRVFLVSGGVILEPTVTAGDFLISGVGTLTDNSTSVTSLNTDGLMSKETITEISWDTVYVDAD